MHMLTFCKGMSKKITCMSKKITWDYVPEPEDPPISEISCMPRDRDGGTLCNAAWKSLELTDIDAARVPTSAAAA